MLRQMEAKKILTNGGLECASPERRRGASTQSRMSRLIARGWVRRRKLMIVATDLDIAKMDAKSKAPLDFASWRASPFRTSPMTLAELDRALDLRLALGS